MSLLLVGKDFVLQWFGEDTQHASPINTNNIVQSVLERLLSVCSQSCPIVSCLERDTGY